MKNKQSHFLHTYTNLTNIVPRPGESNEKKMKEIDSKKRFNSRPPKWNEQHMCHVYTYRHIIERKIKIMILAVSNNEEAGRDERRGNKTPPGE